MKKLRNILFILLPCAIIATVAMLNVDNTKSAPVNTIMQHGGGGGKTSNVSGGSATSTQFKQPSFTVTAASQDWSTMGVTYYDPTTNSMKNYGGSKITVQFAGNSYTAYCLDPQLALPQGELVCNPINYNPQINAFMDQIGSTSGSEAEIQENQLMFRIWAAIEGWTIGEENYEDGAEAEEVYDEDGNLITDKDVLGGAFGKEQKEFKNTVKKYYDVYSCSEEEKDKNGKTCSDYLKDYSYLCGDKTCSDKDTVLSKLVGDESGNFKKTFDKAVDVINNNEQYEEVSTEDIQGQIKAKIVSESKTEIVFEFESTANIDGKEEKVNIPTLSVKCVEGCKEEVITKWNGTYGKYRIKLNEGSCEYKVNLYYDTKGAYECSTNDSNTQTLYTYIDKVSTEAVQQIKGLAPGCTEDCCTEAPVIDPEKRNVSVNNCCSPTTSTVEEYKLNELFCYDKELKVEHYDAKCNSEAFMDEINKFCEMYCTEKATVDLPGAITASSGRYFTLEKNPKGSTTSAYITGTKRCRILTDMELWFGEYNAQVQQQVSYFNLFQEYSAIKAVIENIMEDITTNTYSNFEYECTPSCSGSAKGEKENGTKSLGGNYTIKSYNYEPEDYKNGGKYEGENKYFKANLKESLKDSNKYSKLSVEIAKNPSTLSKLTQYSATESTSLTFYLTGRYVDANDIEKYNDAVEDKLKELEDDLKTSECSYTCKKKNKIEEESSVQYSDGNVVLSYGATDFQQYLTNAESDIERLRALYNAAAKTALQYEEDLNTCHNYFDTVDVKEFYKFNPKQKFSYTQSYLDESGKLKSDRIYVDFDSNPGCKPTIVSAKEGYNDEDIIEPAYSEIYYEKEFATQDMKENEALPWIKDSSEFESLISDEYKGDKAVRNDGKVVYNCEWNEGPNKTYSLAQTGLVVDSTSEINYTIHEREYQIYLSTLEGKYETFWEISGLGSNGKFDKDFNGAGRTCANEDPSKVSMFTCTLAVEHEVVLTGYCNGVTNGTANCDPFKEGYELVNFKVVDPADLFPTVGDGEIPTYEGDQYGHNWMVDPEGQEVLGKIQEKGAEDLTYAPENLSYSFKITPSDMRQIKNYNEERLQYGGYTDFNLKCVCPQDPNPTDGCRKCKSEFVENLSNGIVKLRNGSQEVSGWANERESLGKVRENNNW